MSYEELLIKGQRPTNPHAAADAADRLARMTPAERAEHEAQQRADMEAITAKYQAAKTEREREAAAQREAAEAQRQQAREAAERERALAMWGGPREAFDRQWPGMWETMQAQQTVERMERAQQAQWNLARSAF